jgi:hypothetical protein
MGGSGTRTTDTGAESGTSLVHRFKLFVWTTTGTNGVLSLELGWPLERYGVERDFFLQLSDASKV